MSGIIATLDFIDGRTEVREVEMEFVGSAQFGMLLARRDVVGITLTKKVPLTKIAERLAKGATGDHR